MVVVLVGSSLSSLSLASYQCRGGCSPMHFFPLARFFAGVMVFGFGFGFGLSPRALWNIFGLSLVDLV